MCSMENIERVRGTARFYSIPPPTERTIITKTREFSKTSIHHPNQTSQKFTDFYIEDEDDSFSFPYKPDIYANGYSKLTQGYVSLIFCLSKLPYTCGITFLISVVDIEGCEKFPQSFTITNEPSDADKNWPIITIDNYISRDVLLKEATELIPGDTLTLRFEMCLILTYIHENPRRRTIINRISDSFETEEGPNGLRKFLLLDSKVAYHLMQESEYFRRMCDSPMKEKITGKMEIPYEEYGGFLVLGSVLIGDSSIKVRLVGDIISLYIVSEKYGIDTMINTSRHFLKYCFSKETIDAISEIAERYNDIYLKKAVMVFNEGNKAPDETFIKYCERYFPPIDRPWICKRLENDSKYVLKFRCYVDKMKFDKRNFDFYH